MVPIIASLINESNNLFTNTIIQTFEIGHFDQKDLIIFFVVY